MNIKNFPRIECFVSRLNDEMEDAVQMEQTARRAGESEHSWLGSAPSQTPSARHLRPGFNSEVNNNSYEKQQRLVQASSPERDEQVAWNNTKKCTSPTPLSDTLACHSHHVPRSKQARIYCQLIQTARFKAHGKVMIRMTFPTGVQYRQIAVSVLMTHRSGEFHALV